MDRQKLLAGPREPTAANPNVPEISRLYLSPIQTNNVEADDRGFVYLADRANTGLHIVRLTGEARRMIGGS